MVWAIVCFLYALIADWKGMSVLGVLIGKFLSVVGLMYFCYRIFLMLP
jgi:hypothetical protein